LRGVSIPPLDNRVAPPVYCNNASR